MNPLEESAVWVDETKTVPGREVFTIYIILASLLSTYQAIRNVVPVAEELDALGLRPSKKMDPGVFILLERDIYPL